VVCGARVCGVCYITSSIEQLPCWMELLLMLVIGRLRDRFNRCARRVVRWWGLQHTNSNSCSRRRAQPALPWSTALC